VRAESPNFARAAFRFLIFETSPDKKNARQLVLPGIRIPNNPSPGRPPFPIFHHLTQQNLCYFVAFIGFKNLSLAVLSQ
jgi:hypothetical protein